MGCRNVRYRILLFSAVQQGDTQVIEEMISVMSIQSHVLSSAGFWSLFVTMGFIATMFLVRR
jgi:hypothetical protein